MLRKGSGSDPVLRWPASVQGNQADVTSAIKPEVRNDLDVVEIDGEAVIYDKRTGGVHHLNTTAALVFSVCDGTGTVGDLAADIGAVYGVSSDAVERQVRTLVRRFRKAGLLV